MTDRRTIVLTGATGALGEALAERLSRDHRVICLVRKKAPPCDRVETVRGDVIEPQLGLDDATYADLVRGADCIVHSAAVTNFATDFELIERTNVGGTRNMLELARASEAQFVYVSTAFTWTKTEPVEGLPPTAATRPEKGAEAYEKSKRAAEAMLGESGVPHVVMPASLVMGDSRTGEIGHFQGFHVVLSLIAKGRLPVMPRLPDRPVDFLPRDIMADAVGAVVDGDIREGKYWMTAGERAPTVRDVVELAARMGPEIGYEGKVPRFVDSELIDRLIRPVFLHEMPNALRNQLEELFAMLALVDTREPLPCSLDELGVETPDLLEALDASLRYWVKTVPRPRARSRAVA